MAYRDIDKGSCELVGNALCDCFKFGSSPEGFDFWKAVSIRLRILAKGENPDRPCYGDVPPPELAYQALITQLAERDDEIARQADTIVELRRKLRIADFANMGR